MSLSLPLEPSLTVANLCSLLPLVNSKKWGTEGLPRYLQIPDSEVKEMERLFPDLSWRQSVFIQYFLDGHPAPSWEGVCNALYRIEEYEVLENVQNKYFKGTVCIYIYIYIYIYYSPVFWNCMGMDTFNLQKGSHYCAWNVTLLY